MTSPDIAARLSAAYAGLTAVVTLYGVVEIYRWIDENTLQWYYPVGAVALILAGCVAFFIPVFRRTFNRRFDLRDQPCYVIQGARWKWHINEDCSVVADSTKTMVFLHPPRPHDLSDVAFGSERFKVHNDIYSSRDSRIVNVRKMGGDALRVFWTPNEGAIVPAVAYEHHCRVKFPAPETPTPAKTITIASSAYAVRLDFELTSALPIREAKLARDRDNEIKEDSAKIRAYLDEVLDTHAPLPTLRENCVSFTLRDLAPRQAYYLQVSFEPGSNCGAPQQ